MAHRFELITNEIAWSYKHAIKGINLVWGFSASVNNITYFCRVCKSLFAHRSVLKLNFTFDYIFTSQLKIVLYPFNDPVQSTGTFQKSLSGMCWN